MNLGAAATSPRCLTLAALTLLSACEPASSGTQVEGPTFTLDAQSPVVAFEVTLCMEGPEVRSIQPNASVSASWVSTSDVPVVVTAENLDASPNARDDGDPYLDEGDEPSPEGALRIEINTDNGPWEKRKGLRCQEAQVVQFDAPALAPGESVELTWSVWFRGNFFNGAFGDFLEDEHWIVNIQRL